MRTSVSRLLVCGCALVLASVVLSQGQSYEALVKDARYAAAKGNEYSLRIPGKDAVAQIFYNSPKPFCFAYSIPGEWGYGETVGSWRSRDGQQLVGVLPFKVKDFRRYKGETPVEKAAASFVQDYEKQLKQRVEGASLVAIQQEPMRVWKWSAPPVTFQGREAHLGTKYVVEVGAEGLLVITIMSSNADELGRRILASLKIAQSAPCFLPELEEMLRIIASENKTVIKQNP